MAPAAPLRIVCFFAVVFGGGGGARAAPTVAYDQRQTGEFNLRVDMDDVAVVLLAGGADGAELFPLRRDVRPAGEKAHGAADSTRVLQLLRLAARPKKKNKKPIDCAAAAAVSENPYAETAGAGHRPQSSPPPVPVDYETPQGLPSSPAPVYESRVPVVAAANGDPPPRSGPDEYLFDDPYSVTPGTPDFSERNSLSSADDHMVAVKTVENLHPAPVRADEFPENAVAAVQKTAEAPPPVSTRFEEKPISVSSDAKAVGEKSDGTVAVPRDEAEVEAKIPAEPPPQVPVTADVTKTVEMRPNDPAAGTAAKTVTDENPRAAAAATNSVLTAEKKPEVPVELVAVKTVEKPTFAEALEADGKPSSSTTAAAESAVGGGEKPAEGPAEKSSASDASVDVRVRANEQTTAAETVVVAEAPTETAKKPADAGTAVASGITAGTRPVELVKDKSAAAAKPTAEMVTVKTIENAATTGNAAAKTAVKSGNAKTTLQLSNGSSIVRKVADRRPLPSATFEVAAPNVARA